MSIVSSTVSLIWEAELWLREVCNYLSTYFHVMTNHKPKKWNALILLIGVLLSSVREKTADILSLDHLVNFVKFQFNLLIILSVIQARDYFQFRRGIFIVMFVEDSFIKKMVTLIKDIIRLGRLKTIRGRALHFLVSFIAA